MNVSLCVCVYVCSFMWLYLNRCMCAHMDVSVCNYL